MKTKLLSIFIIICMVLPLFSGCLDMSTIAMSGQPVPVQIGYEKNPADVYSGNYWIVTAQITGNDAEYKLTLPKGTVSGDGATTRETIHVQFTGIDTKWVANLEEDYTPLTYYEYDYESAWWNFWIETPYKETKAVPYMNIAPAGQRLNANAEVKVALPNKLTSITKKITNYDTASQVRIPVKDSNGIERTIFVKFQSIAFRGELPPSGDLSVVKTASSQYQMVTSDELEGGINKWNSHRVWDVSPSNYILIDPEAADDWGDVYNWMSSNQLIRNRAPPSTTTTITTGDDAKISIAYPTTVFAPLVTVYIPEQLAETLTVIEQTPQFNFDEIDRVEGVEGGSKRLTVTGQALGSGTIELSIDSPAVKSDNWVDGREKQLEAGKLYKFDVDLTFNTGLDADREFEAVVLSSAAGLGISTDEPFIIYLADKDVQDKDKHTLTMKAVYKGTDDLVETAPLFEGYGDTKSLGTGSASRELVDGVEYEIYGGNISGWYPKYTAEHPKTIILSGDTTVVIPYSTEPSTAIDITNIVYIIIIILILFLLWYFGIIDYLLTLIMSNPLVALMLLVILAILYLAYVVQQAAETVTTAAEEFSILDWFKGD
jgi:hypothetical protein